MSTYGAGPQNPNQPQVVYVAAVPPPRSLLSRLFGFAQTLFFLFFMLAVLTAIYSPDSISDDAHNKVEERYHSLNKEGVHKVAIIEVDGTIMDSETVRRQCEKATADENVKAIVLRVDSPGGTVTASDQMYHYLRKMLTTRKIPLVVSMGGMAASGGYYISMACGDEKDVIFAEPTTWTGSIGVIIPHYDVSGLLAKWDVSEDSIKSGPMKQVGNPARKMTPEERALLQGLVTDSFDRFKSIVEAGRPKFRGDKAAIEKVTTGAVFSSKQAVELGLVDKIGFLEDAINRALELASLQPGTTKVVEYRKQKTFVDALVGDSAAKARGSELRALLDLATPRAFYLYAWPGLASDK